MKKLLLLIGLMFGLFFSGFATADFTNISHSPSLDLSNAIETHGKKHKTLPKIPPDEDATILYDGLGISMDIPNNDIYFSMDIPKDNKEMAQEIVQKINHDDLTLFRIENDKQCVTYIGEAIVVEDGKSIPNHPCIKWIKKYLDGRLYEFVSYEIIPFDGPIVNQSVQDISFEGYFKERTKHRVMWHKNGGVSLISDSGSGQHFDELGNLTEECRGSCCKTYDKDKREWILECFKY